MTGVGRDAECYFCSLNATPPAPNQAYYGDVTTLTNLTGSLSHAETLWTNAAKTIAGYYAAAFIHTPFLYSTGKPFPEAGTPDAIMGNVVSPLNTAYNSGYPWRFGTRSSGFYYNGPGKQSPPDPWGAMFGIFFQGYQQDLPAQNPGTGYAGTEASQVNNSTYNGIWFEVYKGDCSDSSNYAGFDTFNTQTAATVGTNTYQ
jgi:hypothetical protein